MYQKMHVLPLFNKCPKRTIWDVLFSCFTFFPSFLLNTIIFVLTMLCYGSLIFVMMKHVLPLSPPQTILDHDSGYVCLKVKLLGASSSMLLLQVFPWCKPHWSWDEFNNQSHILREQETTFNVHDVNNPSICSPIIMSGKSMWK